MAIVSSQDSIAPNAMQPSTPRRSPRRILFCDGHPSPQFSDYWTDQSSSLQTSPALASASRKIHGTDEVPADALLACTSAAQRHLLNRLNRLAVRLLSDEPSESLIACFGFKLDELEALVDAPEAQSKVPADIADSGLFIDEDEDGDDVAAEDDDEGDMVGRESGDGAGTRVDSLMGAELKRSMPSGMHELDSRTHKKVDAIIRRVSQTALELRKRLEEVKHFNDVLVTRLERATTKLFAVQTENDRLNQDLAFDQSDLLLLKLQMKSLEIMINNPVNSHTFLDTEVVKAIDKWKDDCADAEIRIGQRKHKHEIFSEQRNRTPKSDAGVQTEVADSGQATSPLHETRPVLGNFDSSCIIANIDNLPTIAGKDPDTQATSHLYQELMQGFSLPQAGDPFEIWLNSIGQLQSIISSLFPGQVSDLANDKKECSCRNLEADDSDEAESKAGDNGADESETESKNDERRESHEQPPVSDDKTPWQELWSSLTEFVGMAEQGYDSN